MKKNDILIRVNIPNRWTRELAEQFGVSVQTVRNALMHINNSETAQAIRREARKRLLHEAGKIQD